MAGMKSAFLVESFLEMMSAERGASANTLDAEGVGECDKPADSLRQTIRYYTALELRNRAARHWQSRSVTRR